MLVRLVFTALAIAVSVPPASYATPGLPAVGATAVVLMEAHSGRVLYAVAPHLRWPPASTTKIMTALLAVKSLPDDLEVPISARAAAQRSGTAIGLEVGERWRVRDLLRAMLLHSANDAAIALAEAAAGSVEAFANQMNALAKALGANESHFAVPHGLHDPLNYSTANDLALIAHAALQKRQIADIVRTQTWELTRPDHPPRLLINSNKLLWRYPGADGVKTGWIRQSGPNLVASATRDGWQLIAVVLNAPQLFRYTTALLDYGFSNFALVKVASKGQVITTIPVPNGSSPLVAVVPEDVFAVVRRGATVSREVHLTENVAPIPRAAVVGSVVFTSEGAVVAQTKLVAHAGVSAESIWTRFVSWVNQTFEARP